MMFSVCKNENHLWELRQTGFEKVLLKADKKETAENAVKYLESLGKWDEKIPFYVQANTLNVFSKAMNYLLHHEYAENTKVHVTDELYIQKEPNNLWFVYQQDGNRKIDNMYGDYDSAKSLALAISRLFDCKYEKFSIYVEMVFKKFRYFQTVNKHALTGIPAPEIPDEVYFYATFLENEDIRPKWEIFEKAWNNLQNLKGLSEVKKYITKLLFQLRGKKKSAGLIKESKTSMHMAFLGNAGTGKTEVARIITDFYFALGYIDSPFLVETDRSGIVGQYIGDTEKNMTELIEKAAGGALFIDEAYSLAGDGRDFGREAINVLIKAMEDRRDELFVILAGYGSDMQRLFDMNQGFRSRIRHYLHFEDYTVKELSDIAFSRLKSFSYKLSDDAKAELEKSISMKSKNGALEGNARSIRNITDDVMAETQARIGKENDADPQLITKNDILAATGLSLPIKNQEGLIEIRKGALQKLHSLVGLQNVKEEAENILNYLSIQQLKFEQNILSSKPRLHMAFLGAPGTGKTTVARIIGTFLRGTGLLPNGHFIEATRSDLVGMYQGHTAQKTNEIIQKALGGILFIDEAYSLYQGENDTFGLEAIAELIAAMENHKDNLVVILAGYEHEIEKLFSANAGFLSRIAYTFHFNSYSVDEMTEITKMNLKKNHLFYHDMVTEKFLEKSLKSYHSEHKEFDGNARWANNFVKKIEFEQSSRLQNSEGSLLTKSDLTNVSITDIEKAIKKMK